MPDRGDGVFSEPTDFLSEINCPECGTPFKAAPVWEFVLRQGRSTCGNCWQIFALKPGAKLDGVTARSEDLERIVDDFETANAGDDVIRLEPGSEHTLMAEFQVATG